MKIKLSPQRRGASLTLSRAGDVLWVNGEPFDFSQLPDGATLPADAIDSDWFAGAVRRVDGELHIPLILPHGPNPSQAVAFPEPIEVLADGPVELPQ